MSAVTLIEGIRNLDGTLSAVILIEGIRNLDGTLCQQ